MRLHGPLSLLIASVGLASSAGGMEILYIHNTNSGTISKVSIPEHEVVGEIEIGFFTDYLASSPDGQVLYVNRIESIAPVEQKLNIGVSGEMIAVDTQTDRILWRMDLDGMPHHMSVSKDGKRMFVPYYDTWWIAVIDLEKHQVIHKILNGHGSHGTKLSRDGNLLYVGSMMNDHLTMIDTKTFDIVGRVSFRDGVRPFAITADGKRAYVQQSWLHGFVVVDLEKRDKLRTVMLPDADAVPVDDTYPQDVNHGIALTRDESLLLVNASVYGYLAVYSHPALELLATIPVGTDPNSIASSGDGRYAYVSNRRSDDLSVIDIAARKEIKRIPLGEKPQRMVVIDVP
ncbi:MAG TPA: beta-propeller fold lactonase family protein [Thermoanaerobaculia bacterium]|nr:beta-propeller fold lactonase family protein [Thermoanaerobaculia bacterium]